MTENRSRCNHGYENMQKQLRVGEGTGHLRFTGTGTGTLDSTHHQRVERGDARGAFLNFLL